MQSPLGSPIPPSDVTEDFRESLKDLRFNSRVEINTLTMIAKENIEHAMALSQVLEHHIKSTPPPSKLPPLYVLDSIVKNVGSPYTLYLGRNLYSTFIDAYTRVDERTRASMEGMLATWKQPVPGSMDSRPVFPANTTNAIETALHKAKMSFAQQQQKQPQMPVYRQQHALPPRPMTGQMPGQQWSPTPVNGSGFAPPLPNGVPYPGYPPQSGYPQPPQMHPYYQQQTQNYPTPVPTQQHYYPPPAPQPQPVYQPPQPHDYAKVTGDLDSLINSMKHKLATNMYDTSLQARLKAMLDLQEAIRKQHLSPQEWDSIRNQLSLLIQQENSPPYNTPPYVRQAPSVPQYSQPQTPTQYTPPTPQPQPAVPPPTQQNLADLLASFAPQRTATPQTNTSPVPPPSTATNGIANLMGVAPAEVPNSIAKDNDLFATLMKTGLIPPPTPQQSHSRTGSVQQSASAYLPPPLTTTQPLPPSANVAAPPKDDLAALLQSLSGPKPPQAPPQEIVELSAASLKIPRLSLITRRLYKSAPNQCKTCGRRFPATQEGKARKARHLDFHFRTNQRAAEADSAGRRGVCRAWLGTEMQWIESRELDDADANALEKQEGAQNGEGAGVGTEKKEVKKVSYVRVPDNETIETSKKTGQPINVCPICQEEHKAVWYDAVQEWCWLDAVKAGARVYHMSCYEDVMRDQKRAKEQAKRLEAANGVKKEVKVEAGSVLGKRRIVEEDANDVTKSPKREEGADAGSEVRIKTEDA